MKKTLIILAIFWTWTSFAIVGCDGNSNSKRGADDYYFEDKEYEQDSFTVRMQLFDTRREFEAAARDKNISNASALGAFATLANDGSSCTIYTIDPTVSYEPEFLGHELAHCAWGRWHEQQNKTRNR